MAWRFKASKYRNATPIVPKPENYVREISVGSYQTHGNNITASALFMAFNWDHVGSSVAVLPLNDSGRKSKLMPLLHAHTDTVTDLDFSPFHDGLLVTGSQDCSVKLWCIPEGGLTDSVFNPECTFSHRQRRVETVKFHPTSDFLLHSSSYTTLTLWDITSQKEIFSNSDEHTDVIQSASWKRDGTLLATSCKDKKLRILDPRAGKFCLGSADSHQSIKDSRVVWLGDRDRVLTSGFNAQRLRQIIVRDIRNLGSMEKELQLDCSTGILIPLYDGDTGMLFLAGKGDTTIGYMEVSDKEPYLVEGIRHSGEQTKGACLVPKRALNVMQGEVNRVLQLTSNSVIPITYQVPRKSYRDFHSDLYPDTSGYVSKLTASQWIAGKDFPVPKISLNPKDRENGDSPITVHRGPLKKLKQDYEATVIAKPEPNPPPTTTTPSPPKPIKPLRNEQEMPKPQPQPLNTVQVEDTIEDSKSEEMVVPPKPLPRTSRAGSLCEPLDEANAPPKPVARSRTNSYAPVITSVNPNAPRSGGYKPRLGPKPFSPPKFDDSESFEKVFSVPTVPGVHSNGSTEPTKILNDSLETKITNDSEETEKIEADIESDVKPNGTTLESPPSTAERRKLFEDQDEEVSNNGEVMDKVDSCEFERNALRKSIAERRKIYENRSLSVQDDNSNSVIAKNRKNVEAIAEDGNVKRQQSLDNTVGKKSGEVISTPTPKRTSTVFGKVSKFRHLKGTPAHKSLHIENLRNLSRQIPGECDGFHANPERAATPLSGPGGKIAILETNKTGRLPDGVIPTLVQGSNVMDFAWDPFDNRRLAVACDDGIVKIWEIPENGLTEPTNEPTAEFQAHPDKIYFVKFNPVAKDVLATGSFDMTVKIWDLNGFQERICLTGHTDQMFSFAWSPCGRYCATVCKDGKIRVFDPRNKDVPIREGNGPVGSRGARIVWALDGNFLVVTGFDKVSERQITVYKWTDLKAPLNVVGLDVSPAILVPFYDEDSSTLFLTGRGDSTIYTFEITEEHPFICPLSHHRCSTLNQGLSFLPKKSCDVTNVEFAKALRLTNNTIEPLSFTVPRIKTDLFQDDLFPPTRVSWNPLLNSEDWFLGKNGVTKRISLQPEGMEPLTSTQNQKSTPEKSANKSSPQLLQHDLTNPCARLVWESQSKMKQEEIQKSVSQRLPVNMKLEQDSMEGVDEKEWEE